MFHYSFISHFLSTHLGLCKETKLQEIEDLPSKWKGCPRAVIRNQESLEALFFLGTGLGSGKGSPGVGVGTRRRGASWDNGSELDLEG